MGTAIVVAIVSGIVSLVSVAANAFITITNVRAESTRAREAREAEDRRARDGREAEDRRLREDRNAEAKRREDEAAGAAARAVRADRDARVQQRWAAVQEVIDAETKLRASSGMLHVYNYRTLVQSLSLLTHPDESNLRRELRNRAHLAGKDHQTIGAQIKPDWWHPWVSEWVRSLDEPMLTAMGDGGHAF